MQIKVSAAVYQKAYTAYWAMIRAFDIFDVPY